MTRPSPLARCGAGLIAALLAVGALTACDRPSTPVSGRAAGDAVPADSTPVPTATPDPVPPVPTPAPTATPKPPAKRAGTPPRAPRKPPKPRPAPKPAPRLPGVSAAAQAVLEQINAWRAAKGLRPYVMLPGLVRSAHKHNLRMAAGCGLSHKCNGEAAFGDRIRVEGVNWSSAGENCGVGGGISNNTSAITRSAKGLNQSMFDEKPPNDGHRRNLLSKSFTHIGIDVVRDSKGNVWLTQDFTS